MLNWKIVLILFAIFIIAFFLLYYKREKLSKMRYHISSHFGNPENWKKTRNGIWYMDIGYSAFRFLRFIF